MWCCCLRSCTPQGEKCPPELPKKTFTKDGTKAGPSLNCDRIRTALSQLQKNIRKSWHAATSISTQSWGGSYGLSKSLKWKRNVTGDPKANGFCHWLQLLLKIARDDIFSEKISLCKCLYYNQDSTDGILFKLRRVVFKRRERDRASECPWCVFLYLPAKRKHNHQWHPTFNYDCKMGEKTEGAIFISLISDTPSSWLWIIKLHAVSCVLWLALQQLANRRRLFCSSCHTQGKCFFHAMGELERALSLEKPADCPQNTLNNIEKAQKSCLKRVFFFPTICKGSYAYVLTSWLVSFNQVKAWVPAADHSSDLSVLLPAQSGWIKLWTVDNKRGVSLPKEKPSRCFLRADGSQAWAETRASIRDRHHTLDTHPRLQTNPPLQETCSIKKKKKLCKSSSHRCITINLFIHACIYTSVYLSTSSICLHFSRYPLQSPLRGALITAVIL